MAQHFATRPSAIIGIPDRFTAYAFDLAVMRLGIRVNNELSASYIKSKGQHQRSPTLEGGNIGMQRSVHTLQARGKTMTASQELIKRPDLLFQQIMREGK